jgi:hypothetical protein
MVPFLLLDWFYETDVAPIGIVLKALSLGPVRMAQDVSGETDCLFLAGDELIACEFHPR